MSTLAACSRARCVEFYSFRSSASTATPGAAGGTDGGGAAGRFGRGRSANVGGGEKKKGGRQAGRRDCARRRYSSERARRCRRAGPNGAAMSACISACTQARRPRTARRGGSRRRTRVSVAISRPRRSRARPDASRLSPSADFQFGWPDGWRQSITVLHRTDGRRQSITVLHRTDGRTDGQDGTSFRRTRRRMEIRDSRSACGFLLTTAQRGRYVDTRNSARTTEMATRAPGWLAVGWSVYRQPRNASRQAVDLLAASRGGEWRTGRPPPWLLNGWSRQPLCSSAQSSPSSLHTYHYHHHLHHHHHHHHSHHARHSRSITDGASRLHISYHMYAISLSHLPRSSSPKGKEEKKKKKKRKEKRD